MKVERPYAYCCAQGGGDPRYCDCVNKQHGTAIFDVRESASDEVPANPVGEGLVEALEKWRLRDGYVPAYIAGWNRALDQALREIAALAGKSADAASSQEQGASGEVAK